MESIRARRRRVRCVLLPIFAVALATATAVSAATPPAGSVSSSNTSTTFSGTLTMTNSTPEELTSYGSPCPSQAMDSLDATCGHFTLTVQNPGSVQVCIQFSPVVSDLFGMTDLDVYVADTTPGSPTNGTVIASGTSQADPECTSFNATAGGTYEILVSPSFVFGPTNYTGTVILTPTGAGGGGAGGGGNGMPTGQKMTGGGATSDGKFGLSVFQSDPSKSKVRWMNASCSVRTDTLVIDSMGPNANGNGGFVTFHGTAHANGNPVTYQGRADDHTEPSASDDFFLTVNENPA